jgi:hypothetical protein
MDGKIYHRSRLIAEICLQFQMSFPDMIQFALSVILSGIKQ